MKKPAIMPMEVHVERSDRDCRSFLGAVNGKQVPKHLREVLVSIPDRFMEDPDVATVFHQLTALVVTRLVKDATGRDQVRVITEDPNPTKQ